MHIFTEYKRMEAYIEHKLLHRDARSPALRQSLQSPAQVQSWTLKPPAFRESKTGFIFS